MTTEGIARMNAAIEKLELEYGMKMQMKVGKVKDVKKYLKYQQDIVNSDGAGAYPAFLRVIEVIKKLKDDN